MHDATESTQASTIIGGRILYSMQVRSISSCCGVHIGNREYVAIVVQHSDEYPLIFRALEVVEHLPRTGKVWRLEYFDSYSFSTGARAKRPVTKRRSPSGLKQVAFDVAVSPIAAKRFNNAVVASAWSEAAVNRQCFAHAEIALELCESIRVTAVCRLDKGERLDRHKLLSL